MSERLCKHCGRDCKTVLALAKHEVKCNKKAFSDRHNEDRYETCPKCLDSFKTHQIINDDTWVCLQCGIHFTPKKRLEVVRAKLKQAGTV